MDVGIPCHPNEISEGIGLDDLKELFPYVDESWIPSNVKLKVFNNGITNKLIGCFVSENGTPHREKAAVVRIFGKCTEKFLDRERELLVQVVLSKAGFAPPVFVSFPNGVCYGFINGKTLTPETVKEPHISSLIAAKLAAYHCLSFEKYLPEKVDSLDTLFGMSSRKPFLWKKMGLFLDIIDKECASDIFTCDRFAEVFGSIQLLREEVNLLKAHIETFCATYAADHPIAFCHNDLLLNNILFDTEKDEVHFIDFEYADFNYAAFDIANHFVEYCGVDDVDFSRYPSKEYQMKWIKMYLQNRHSVLKINSPVGDNDVNSWYVLIQKFSLAAYLIWSVWALVQNEFSDLDFDFFEFGVQRYQQYRKFKEQNFGLSVSALL